MIDQLAGKIGAVTRPPPAGAGSEASWAESANSTVAMVNVLSKGRHIAPHRTDRRHAIGWRAGRYCSMAEYSSADADQRDVMKIPRRQILSLAAGAATVTAFSEAARPEAYPARPVRIIVGFPAGGPSDILARLIGKWLSERVGQQFFVENLSGAGSSIAAEAVVRSPPDGYTLLLVGTPNTINASLYNNLNFDITRDIAPIAGIMRVPNVVAVAPSLPVKTLPDFIAYAKARPDKIKMASVGVATRLSGELFKMMTGLSMSYVGSSSLVDMLAGLFRAQTQVAFDGLPSSVEYIRTKKLRALAVTTASRSNVLPEIPPVGDFVRGYEASAWFGLGASRETPAEIVDLLNREINLALANRILKGRIADLGGTELPGTPAEFGTLLSDETEKWRRVVLFSGINAN
jgi:tripartite-type tricarboxylate transporter receptor subunit TctC